MLEIKDASADDAVLVGDMYRAVFPGDAHATAPEAAHAYVREEIARPWTRMRVAWLDGAAVGFAFTWRVVDELHLLNVAVLPAARRAGIGLALTNDILDHAMQEGIARILLEARGGNEPALALYRGVGFVETGVRRRYYADGEDAVEMTWSRPL